VKKREKPTSLYMPSAGLYVRQAATTHVLATKGGSRCFGMKRQPSSLRMVRMAEGDKESPLSRAKACMAEMLEILVGRKSRIGLEK
jgi:hypothetical protein